MTVKLFYYYFFYFCVAAALAVLLVPLMRPFSFSVGAVDDGKGRRVHKGIVPRLGGIGIFAAFMLPAVFSLTRGEWDIYHDRFAAIFAVSLIVFVLGVWDDIRGARVWNKLAVETAAAVIIYMLGIRITDISNPLGGGISLGWLGLPVTVLWIIVITNAFNLIDGLDGLAAGTGILIIATLFLLSGDNVHMKIIFVIMAGSLAGFLLYNFPPATIFMGDSGSLFLGFLLGCISILTSKKATAMATMMVPMIAFSLPIMDMLYAVLRRYYRGIPLGEADREHIHHKLLQKGLSKKKVLFLLYSVNIGVLLLALVMVWRQLNVDFFGLLLLSVLAVAGLRMLGYIEFSPFIREITTSYKINRKRKYFHFLIRGFRHDAAGSRTADDLRSYLTRLMEEYDFDSAEIRLGNAGVSEPFYSFRSRPDQDESVTLTFPLSSQDNKHLGEVRISKRISEETFLCTAEMVGAISEEVVRFLQRDRHLPQEVT